MGRDLTLRRFSNFDSPTVRDPLALRRGMQELETVAADPLFHTRVGRSFAMNEVDAAMAYETSPGAKAVFVI